MKGVEMPFRSFLFFLFCLTASGLALSQQPETTDLSGNWLITADLFGTLIYERMDLAQSGKNVTGKYTGDKITSGEAVDRTLHLLVTSDDGSTSDVNARLEGATLTGTAVQTDPKDKDHPTKYTFTARRIEPVQHRAPQRHEFTPTVFYRQFSPNNKPVLTISPGDTVHTTTVDAGGTDEKGVSRVLGGNPETARSISRVPIQATLWWCTF
jgi:amidase